MKKILKKFILYLLIFLLISACFFFIGSPKPAKEITWGVNFSQKQAERLGLDWQKTYLALLDDLKVKNLKILTHWDLIEPREGEYNFVDLDWQIKKAEERGAKIILVIGMKTGRWPECHLPVWAKDLSKKDRQDKILKLIEKTVLRYRDRVSVRTWQVENEPFFPFGECPKIEKKFLQKEINLVSSLDPKRQILISDSGEFSFWLTAAKLGDVVGSTLHRRVWSKEFKIYVTHYWFRPIYYWRKAQIIKKFFDKEVICTELQAEPWCPTHFTNNYSLKEQQKTMDLDKFRKNIDFAKKTGLNTFYLWGGEWWYWLKEKQNQPQIWNEAKKLW